jgi:hypothetical protein
VRDVDEVGSRSGGRVGGWAEVCTIGQQVWRESTRTHLALKSLGRDVGGLDHREEPQKPRARHIDVVENLLLPRC